MLTLRVNGCDREIAADPTTPLLYVLRNELELTAAKLGCGLEQCGACAVLVDGKATMTCGTPSSVFAGKEVVTVEGLGGSGTLSRLQEAFLAEQAAQCGYCIPGIVIAATALLREDPAPSDSAVNAALAAHLCRCGAHPRILRAVRRAASETRP